MSDDSMEEEDSEKSDSIVINNCEREPQNTSKWDSSLLMSNPSLNTEKRQRDKSEESSEEGFITITKRKSKRLLRSDSLDIPDKNSTTINKSAASEGSFEIILTSLNILPKQMALAKLLCSENIEGITNVKFKNPFKVSIRLNSKEQAERVITSQKLKDLDIRANFADESLVSYGIIRGVDLEMSEEEILESLTSSAKILSIKRMRRMNLESKWVDSETVRICFKSAVIPSYIYAFGCRFGVEKYMFSVMQCSACWKFGHIRKYCPYNKILCPKCGNEHSNCETQTFKCLNCKGPHMSLDKTCPTFLKEKKIRFIMSKENINYKNALDILLKINGTSKDTKVKERFNLNNNMEKTFPLLGQNRFSTLEHSIENSQEDLIEDFCDREEDKGNMNLRFKSPNKKSKKNQNTEPCPIHMCQESMSNEPLQRCEIGNNEEKLQKRFKLRYIFVKMKEIFLSKNKFEDKIVSIFEMVVHELKSYICNFFNCEQFLKNIVSLFNG